jgi:hypothetical protein
MGNFRGVWPRKLAETHNRKNYWDYTIDDLAQGDVKSFVQAIIKLKREEFQKRSLKIKLSNQGLSYLDIEKI